MILYIYMNLYINSNLLSASLSGTFQTGKFCAGGKARYVSFPTGTKKICRCLDQRLPYKIKPQKPTKGCWLLRSPYSRPAWRCLWLCYNYIKGKRCFDTPSANEFWNGRHSLRRWGGYFIYGILPLNEVLPLRLVRLSLRLMIEVHNLSWWLPPFRGKGVYRTSYLLLHLFRCNNLD